MSIAALKGDAPLRRGTALLMVVGAIGAGGLLGLAAATSAFTILFAVGLVVAVLVADATWRWPSAALLGLIVFLPLYPVLFGLSQKFGVPSSTLGYMRYWKDLVLVVLAARTVSRTSWRDLDGLDRAALAYLLVAAFYVVLPIGTSIYARALGARDLAAALAVFLVVRHVGLPAGTGRRVEVSVLVTGSIIAVVALWNYFSPDAYTNWIVGLAQWQADILGQVGKSQSPIFHTLVAGKSVVRAGSIFVNPLTTAFYLLIPVGIVIGRVCAGEARQACERALGVLCLAGLLVTVTRSAIATLPVVLAVGVLAGRRPGRAFTLILVGTIVLYPLISSLGLGQQFSGALDPNQVSTAGHLAALGRDVAVISAVPWGLGLAQGGSEGQRFGVATAITAESWYLQIAVELGVLGLVAFSVVLARTLRALSRRVRQGEGVSLAALCALTGVAAGGIFLHSFADLHTAYTVWALAALGVGVALNERAGPNLGPG